MSDANKDTALNGQCRQQALTTDMEHQLSIVEHATNLAMCVTPEAVVEYVNPAVVSVTGYTRHELMTAGLDILVGPKALKNLKEVHIPNAIHGETVQYELVISRKDGEKRILIVSVVQTGNGNLGIIANDITEVRKLESRLYVAIRNAECSRDIAECSSIAKSEFLSRMSHELLTPMNAVIGFAQLAKKSKDLEKIKSYIDKIENSSNHLVTMIHDVLDVSDGGGSFSINESRFYIKTMVDSVLEKVNPELEKKKHILTQRISPSTPEVLIGDDKRISQVILHLLSNAIKFSPEGSEISLCINASTDECEIVTLEIEVADNGIGISKKQQKRLFGLFELADGSSTRKFSGIGIGLPLAKCIANMMDGDIRVESELGKGARFLFSFKVKKG